MLIVQNEGAAQQAIGRGYTEMVNDEGTGQTMRGTLKTLSNFPVIKHNEYFVNK